MHGFNGGDLTWAWGQELVGIYCAVDMRPREMWTHSVKGTLIGNFELLAREMYRRIDLVMADAVTAVVGSEERPGRVWVGRGTGDWRMAVEW
jgi:hypothetical protein